MKLRFLIVLLFGLAVAPAGAQLPLPGGPSGFANGGREEFLNHDLDILINPRVSSIRVVDAISFPASYQGRGLTFTLNENLRIDSSSLPVQEIPAPVTPPNVIATTVAQEAPGKRYRVNIPANFDEPLEIVYFGQINDQAEQTSPEYAQSFSETSGIISAEGVFLSRASLWVPLFDDELITFSLQASFSPSVSGWTTVTQGDSQPIDDGSRQGADTLWVSTEPMEEIYLVAAEFTVYSEQADDVEVQAYLRTPDSNLATRYLDATQRYLQLYEPLLGEYPYSKFALVENFWETGYGMPSFTLLGEQVIRFPFILESSYPHEILHNWWGNGVYPDYDSGNWSEGLTAYLADHLFQEMNGAGQEYRKDMLARYKNYVAEGDDFPLSEFTARNSAATQAVGYGKTLMLWHMLRLEVGDELFLQGLRKLYGDYKFRRASFEDIAAIYTELSGIDLLPFFDQWVNRTGAPELSITVEETSGNRARIMFAQTQFGDPYQLKVPVALFYEGEAEAQVYEIALSQKLEGVMAEGYDLLQGVLVDPYFDVFRQLDREETPPTIGEMFGASEIAFVLPGAERSPWAQMAEEFAGGTDMQLLFADQLDALPEDRSVWVLGRDNPFAPAVAEAVAPYGVIYGGSGVALAGEEVPFQDRSTVVVGRHPDDPELALGWIHIDDMVALPGMIEKLPHYGKYSYLSFVGDEPTNDIKGVWASPDSPMQWVKPDSSSSVAWDALPATLPLATLPPKYLPEQMLRHGRHLSSVEMEGRGLGTDGLDRSAYYIADQFRAAGLQPLDGTYIQRWQDTYPGLGNIELANVVGMIPGSNRALSARPVVLGAHYDHLGLDSASGRPFPGADDNASGVAILIETAAKLARAFSPQRPILFVAFTGEESGLLGSRYFVQNPPGGFQTEDLFAMINLDTVGRLEGRTLQVFGSESAYEWPFMAQGIGFTIGVQSSFPQQTIAASDHVSFLNAGVPAIHLFSGAHLDYHRATDTVDKLDTAGMADVALWVEEAIVYLGERVDPLRVNLANAAPIELSGQTAAREASLGTVPDFAYSGDGIRISAVTPTSAAAEAGLQAGDVLLRFNETAIQDLQAYSNLLRERAPGDRVRIELRRGGATLTVEATLKAR